MNIVNIRVVYYNQDIQNMKKVYNTGRNFIYADFRH